ncbi:DNA alkylation repair enzyme [Ligilactobacillus salivarius ACS-116-V-Col5a]|nr:DNA alkylation repair enzyme [Ligilactobacillus salivarius ACS-116-V-Col5a]
MLEWSVSDDIWFRRIAINHQRGRKDKTDTVLLEKILINNLNNNEFFINKAIGWALRDYSKTNTDWVKNFIAKYKPGLSTLSIREASKCLE